MTPQGWTGATAQGGLTGDARGRNGGQPPPFPPAVTPAWLDTTLTLPVSPEGPATDASQGVGPGGCALEVTHRSQDCRERHQG